MIRFILAFVLSLVGSGCAVAKNHVVEPCKGGTTVVDAGSIVIAKFASRMPTGFAIADPDGNWSYVRESSKSLAGNSEAVYRISADGVRFDTRKLRGVREEGKGDGLVFSKPGLYRLYFADNLDTEPENTFSCSSELELKGR